MWIDESGWEWNYVRKKVLRNIVIYDYRMWKATAFYYVHLEVVLDCFFLVMLIEAPNRVVYADVGPYSGSRDALCVLARESVMSFLSKQPENAELKSLLTTQVDEGLQKKHPALYEYLTACKYPDGSHRETATLSVSVQEDGYKFMLRDRDQSRCLWVTSQSFFDGLKTLDAALRSSEAPWVKDRFSTNGVAKGKVGKKN